MHPVSPVLPDSPTIEHTLAANQPEYQPLPVVLIDGGQSILSRWQLTDDEVNQIIKERSIWLHQTVFKKPPQPIILLTEPPKLDIPESALIENTGWEETFEDG